jgi:mannose-6-phosphate isomerase-like protein (cupin superfamily)
MTKRMTPTVALDAVNRSEEGEYGVVLRHGAMELGYYVPREIDRQTPHEQDEVYVIHRGSGVFLRGDERIEFAPGDALFVPAGMQHRFLEFSDDFGAWVVLYGPDSSEDDA